VGDNRDGRGQSGAIDSGEIVDFSTSPLTLTKRLKETNERYERAYSQAVDYSVEVDRLLRVAKLNEDELKAIQVEIDTLKHEKQEAIDAFTEQTNSVEELRAQLETARDKESDLQGLVRNLQDIERHLLSENNANKSELREKEKELSDERTKLERLRGEHEMRRTRHALQLKQLKESARRLSSAKQRSITRQFGFVFATFFIGVTAVAMLLNWEEVAAVINQLTTQIGSLTNPQDS
jgi:chromosome segregation ATPase